MFTTVLAPLDGSMLARKAIPYAAALARQSQGRLVFLQATTSDEHDEEAEALRDFGAEGLRTVGLQVETRTVRCEPGRAAAAILEAAKETAADVIVMASHGRGELSRLVLGSVAERTLREVDVPVLLVTSRCERPWPAGRAPRVVVPLDGSTMAESALASARGVAGMSGGTIILVHVIDVRAVVYANAYAYTESLIDAEMHSARRYLQGVAGTLAETRATVDVRVEVGIPDLAIADAAQETDADLIVMATHGRSGMDRVFLGSVAFGVLHRARTPLLLVRAAPEAAEVGATGADGTANLALSRQELLLIQAGLERMRLDRDERIATPEEIARLAERLRAASPTQ